MAIEGFDRQRRLFEAAPRGKDKVYFALRPDAESLGRLTRLAEELSIAFPLTARPNFGTLHVSVLGLGYAADMRAEHYALATEVGRAVRFPPFRLLFTRLMSFGIGRRQMPLALIADDDSAVDVNDLATVLRGELVARGFSPRGRAGGHAHMTLLYERVRVPKVVLETPIALRADGIALIRNHHGEGRHDVEAFTLRS
jgi:2'-5' RNA ligase